MRYIAVLLSFYMISTCPAFSVRPGQDSPAYTFPSDTKFLIGFKGGINYTNVFPTARFPVLQPVQGWEIVKDYAPLLNNMGYHYGFIGMFKINRFLSLSLEPAFSTYTFHYSTEWAWYDSDDPSDRIEINSEFTDKLKYFEIPLVLRYEFGNGIMRPYLLAGFFYGMFTGAQGKASSATSQYLDNIVTTVDNGETTGDISGNYINIRLAAFPGAGVYTDLSFATIFAEAGYNISLHNIVDESARYSNEQTVGSIFNVSDNIRFENLFFNIGILYTINKMETGRRGKSRLSGKAVGCPPPKKKR